LAGFLAFPVSDRLPALQNFPEKQWLSGVKNLNPPQRGLGSQ
jgi:hypothetical protein